MAAKFQDNLEGLSESDLHNAKLQFINELLFETPGGVRYTQDTPILPNVWLAYAIEPRSQQELILTISQDGGTGKAAKELRTMLMHLRKKRPYLGKSTDKGSGIKRKRARVSYIPGQIAVKLYFDELLRVVLPLTPWWHEIYDKLRVLERAQDEYAEAANWLDFPQPDERRQSDLTDILMLMRQDIDPTFSSNSKVGVLSRMRANYIRDMPPDLGWFVRIAGLISNCFTTGQSFLEKKKSLSRQLRTEFCIREMVRDNDRIGTSKERAKWLKAKGFTDKNALKIRKGIVSSFLDIYDDWNKDSKATYPSDRLIWRVTKNRPIKLAVAKSTLTVKSDAAKRLFNVSCENITWAVLDSGIDSNHPAFKRTTPEHEQRVIRGLKKNEDYDYEKDGLKTEHLGSRVVKTLDFTRLRELLDFDIDLEDSGGEFANDREKLETELARRMAPPKGDPDNRESKDTPKDLLENLHNRIKNGKDISWQDLEAAILDRNPEVPVIDHGTHVAGILGADWIEDDSRQNHDPLAQRTRRMQGVCPDINLIDVRVFREDGLTDEFELLAAVQFLRWMNSRAGTMEVHGANLSLSLIHEVRRFACGQTPICVECNEAAALGMVIVAAAGNRGFEMSDIQNVGASDSYKSVSITDPGNAEKVITVGATHRKRPHEYGVSYFSSRGPTGDGRLKPDLVAPGEKIKGPTPNGRAEYKDGTSMAAPHVSGVAAMLMARHSELIGQPDRIKKILCDTATDLNRERYFQGNGLVDALRALQSV